MKPLKLSNETGAAAAPKIRKATGSRAEKSESLINIYLTPRQLSILTLLYRFRFLTRPQLQHLLNLHSHQRLTLWLKNLSEQQLIKQYKQTALTEPPIYSLGTKSRTVLKTAVKNASVLKRIRWEANYSDQFRAKCLLLADMYIELLGKYGDALHFRTNTELKSFDDLISPPPDAYFTINNQRYFLDVLTNVPLKYLRERVRRYGNYFDEGTWQEKTEAEFPTVILICPNDRIARQLTRFVDYEYSDEPDLRFFVSSDRTLTFIEQ